MRRFVFSGVVILVFLSTIIPALAGCFPKSGSTETSSPTVVKPSPQVINVVATTSGTQDAYYATLDIKVKNLGAEGTILVRASVTQDEKTSTSEMPVFLKKNETHELKMTFPLVWQGGEFTSNVETIVP